jgi:hypothetical protein
MANGQPVKGSVYIYAPNKIAPAIFAGLFLISGALHLYQCIRYKCLRITIFHPFCCLLFVTGFALREYGSFDIDHLNVYIASTMFIYTSPPILELANYHVLGRILYYVPYNAPLHPGRTLTTFGFMSAIVEVMNAIGVSYTANRSLKPSLQDLGHILMKTSLIVQVVVITIFCGIAGLFHRRCVRGGVASRSVKGPLWTLYASMLLILIRTIYRIVDHFAISKIPTKVDGDWDPKSLSPMLRWEWYFYTFEASLMLINTFLWNVRHPRFYLPEDYHVYLAQDGRTEIKGPGWESNRPWFITFLDPFDFIGIMQMCMGKDKQHLGANGEKPFWETNGFQDGARAPLKNTMEEVDFRDDGRASPMPPVPQQETTYHGGYGGGFSPMQREPRYGRVSPQESQDTEYHGHTPLMTDRHNMV